MTNKLKYGAIILIGISFLVYGGVRTGVSSLLLLQMSGFIHFAELGEAIVDIDAFMSVVHEAALFAMPTFQYLIYLWVMGALLIVGAAGIILRKSFGPNCIYAFIALHIALFVIFQTINPKIFYVFISLSLLQIHQYLAGGFPFSKR